MGYIELLGGMYLMKLRYGSNFAKTAGSCWRILFVFALMPWLRKYRVMARPALVPDKNDQSADDCDDDGTIFFDNATIATNTAHYRNYSRKTPSSMGQFDNSNDNNNKTRAMLVSKVKRSSSGSSSSSSKKGGKENVGRERSASDSDLRNKHGNKKKKYRFEC